MNQVKRSMLVCMLAIVLTTLLTAGVAQAAGLSGGKWSIIKSSNAPPSEHELHGVAVVSANDIWAVGSYYHRYGPYQTLIEHWNGSSWQVIPSPNPGSYSNFLRGVAVVSATDIWAVGYYNSYSSGQTLIEHWNGSSWQVVASPNVGSADNGLFGVAVVSAKNIWAVGGYYNTSNSQFQTLIEHWNGSSWQVVASPNLGSYSNGLNGVATVSATDIWAVGSPLIEHWNGSSWQVASSPIDTLNGVAVVSASNIWAVGYYFPSSGPSQTLVEHWNGSSWQVVASPNPGPHSQALNGVAVVSASNLWAVGSYTNSNFVGQTLIEHWNGTSWQVVASPNVGPSSNVLQGVAVVSASNLWAVGSYENKTLIEHWNGTSWQVVASPNVG